MKSLLVNRVFVILLITLFISGGLATASMAHCGDSLHSVDSVTSTTPSMDKAVCKDHQMDSSKTANSTDASHHDSSHHSSSGEKDTSSDPSACSDCDGSFCNNQTHLSALSGLLHIVTASTRFTSLELKLQTVYISSIPEPPQTIS